MDPNFLNLNILFERQEICDYFADAALLAINIERYLTLAAQTQRVCNKRTGSSIIINSVIDKQVYIGDFCIIRNSIIKNGAKIGGHCQLNSSVIQEDTELPHFNNVAYSILGRRVLFGACTSTCSRRLDGKRPRVKLPNGVVMESSSERIGALIGDDCRIGGNSTINPFTIIPKATVIKPNTSIVGYVS